MSWTKNKLHRLLINKNYARKFHFLIFKNETKNVWENLELLCADKYFLEYSQSHIMRKERREWYMYAVYNETEKKGQLIEINYNLAALPITYCHWPLFTQFSICSIKRKFHGKVNWTSKLGHLYVKWLNNYHPQNLLHCSSVERKWPFSHQHHKHRR